MSSQLSVYQLFAVKASKRNNQKLQVFIRILQPIGDLGRSLVDHGRARQVFQVQRAANVSLFQLRVERRDPAKEVVSRIAGLDVWREIQQEARTDSGKPGSLDLFGHEKVGSLLLLLLPRRRTSVRTRIRSGGIDTVMHVDANGLGTGPAQCADQPDPAAAFSHAGASSIAPPAPRNRQEFSPRKTGIIFSTCRSL